MTTDTPIDFSRMAVAAHTQLIEQIAADQAELVQIEQLKRMFKDRALPPARFMRGWKDAFRDAPRRMTDHEKRVRNRLQHNYHMVEFLEAVFHEEQKADMDAFAQMVRERFQAQKRGSPQRA